MKQNIDRQSLDHIQVWECIVDTLDGDPALQIKRNVSEHRDELVITNLQDAPKENQIFINTDSAHILATALQLMDSDE